MRWCSLQTNEHDLQAIMYPIICKYHRLNINNGNKVPVFPGYICNRWQNMIVQPSQTHNQFEVWIGSNRSPRCHVTTLSWRQVSQSPPPPVTKMRVLVFRGRLGVWNRTAPDRRHINATRGDNEVDHAVCLQAEFQMHAVLSNENDKFYTTMIYPCFSRSVCFSMGSPAWWRFGLCSSGSSLVSRWRDAPLVHARISNMTSQM